MPVGRAGAAGPREPRPDLHKPAAAAELRIQLRAPPTAGLVLGAQVYQVTARLFGPQCRSAPVQDTGATTGLPGRLERGEGSGKKRGQEEGLPKALRRRRESDPTSTLLAPE